MSRTEKVQLCPTPCVVLIEKEGAVKFLFDIEFTLEGEGDQQELVTKNGARIPLDQSKIQGREEKIIRTTEQLNVVLQHTGPEVPSGGINWIVNHEWFDPFQDMNHMRP